MQNRIQIGINYKKEQSSRAKHGRFIKVGGNIDTDCSIQDIPVKIKISAIYNNKSKIGYKIDTEWRHSESTFALPLKKSSSTFMNFRINGRGVKRKKIIIFFVNSTKLNINQYNRLLLFTQLYIRSCLYEKNHPRRLTCVRSRQDGVFHFVKANLLYENGFIPTSWDLASTQVSLT